MSTSPKAAQAGALVISLDFELFWGFRDHRRLDAALKAELIGARKAVAAMLKLFSERNIHASWATVGFLQLWNKSQLQAIAPPPESRPRYVNTQLDPYKEEIGADETVDPYRYAASLVKQIVSTEGQELSTHTFSHYYCLEQGQTGAAFAADIAAALAAARLHRQACRSIVFPRNQHNSDYSPILADNGIEAYRGNPLHPIYSASEKQRDHVLWKRVLRLLDSYVNLTGDHLQEWREAEVRGGLINLRASRFLRPWSRKLSLLEPLKVSRIKRGIRAAGRSGSIFHLWWHPHNFANNLDKNMGNLELILDELESCRGKYDMASLNMEEIIDMVKADSVLE